MAGRRIGSVLLFCLVASLSLLQRLTLAEKKSYVVYLGLHSHGRESTLEDRNRATKIHYELLGSYLGCQESAQKALTYSYRGCINGFAAHLDKEEATEILKNPKVISVFPNKKNRLYTTRSWSFMGVEREGIIPPNSIWAKAGFGEDIIIGSFDSGVWPESKSFSDEGMGPISSRWKGSCQNDTSGVKCNRPFASASKASSMLS